MFNKIIRILDFTRVLAGPFATRIPADFGAEVIKVESIRPVEEDTFARAYYNTWNRNKRSITLDLSKPEGIEMARKLVSISDAVVENFTPRVMANWGLDYESLKQIKPDIIMVSLSVMGQNGPRHDFTGYGATVQALAGMTYLTSYLKAEPVGLGYSYTDHVAGLYGALALLGALEERRLTGKGKYIDISEVNAMNSLLGEAKLEQRISGKATEPRSNASNTMAPYGVYRCKGDDRWCAISVADDEEWENFRKALAGQSWVDEDRFQNISGRLGNRAELDKLVELWTMQTSAEDVMMHLQEHGVAAGVVRNAADLASDPQLNARGFFLDKTGYLYDASPIRLSLSPAEYERSAPRPGQDNDYVYGVLLGMKKEEINNLKNRKII